MNHNLPHHELTWTLSRVSFYFDESNFVSFSANNNTSDSIPMKFLKPKLEPLDEESSRDGFTPLETMAHIKTEAGLGM